MDEPGGIQGALRRLAPKTMMRQTAKLVVHQRDEPVQRLFVPIGPLAEQQRDVGW